MNIEIKKPSEPVKEGEAYTIIYNGKLMACWVVSIGSESIIVKPQAAILIQR